MGYWLYFFWEAVFLEEIQRISYQEWKSGA